MPAEEYKTASSGSLKLKGVTNSKVSKKKKKGPKTTSDAPSQVNASSHEKTSSSKVNAPDKQQLEHQNTNEVKSSKEVDQIEEEEVASLQKLGKTEAELRHEERRRRRLDERLKREGTKTHKERVEELNRYLSNLSEHHDMPRIGPG